MILNTHSSEHIRETFLSMKYIIKAYRNIDFYYCFLMMSRVLQNKFCHQNDKEPHSKVGFFMFQSACQDNKESTYLIINDDRHLLGSVHLFLSKAINDDDYKFNACLSVIVVIIVIDPTGKGMKALNHPTNFSCLFDLDFKQCNSSDYDDSFDTLLGLKQICFKVYLFISHETSMSVDFMLKNLVIMMIAGNPCVSCPRCLCCHQFDWKSRRRVQGKISSGGYYYFLLLFAQT